jgi:hypothetical protein
MENRNQPEGVARSKIFKVVVGNQVSWYVGIALKPEDLVFEIHEAAAFEAQLE